MPSVHPSLPPSKPLAPRRTTRTGHGAAVNTAEPLVELFGSRARAEVLRILFGIAHEEVYLAEIARRSGMAEQGVDEQLRIFFALGLVTSRPDGNRRYFRANAEHPFFPELCAMVRKSSGLRDIVAEALTSPRIEVAFIFGSIAKGEARPDSDVDLMVIGELGSREAGPLIRPLHEKLGREVNTCNFSRAEVARRLQIKDPFFSRVCESPKLFVVGSEERLLRVLGEARGTI